MLLAIAGSCGEVLWRREHYTDPEVGRVSHSHLFPLSSLSHSLVLSESNPFYFKGSAGEGIGGPHIGPGYIWPMSLIVRAMTSTSDEEISVLLKVGRWQSGLWGWRSESLSSCFSRPSPRLSRSCVHRHPCRT